MRMGWIAGAVVLLLPVPGRSAPAPRPRSRAAAPARETGTDLSASYSRLSAGEADLNGADFSASFGYRGPWRLAADLSVHAGSFAGADLRQVTLMGGLRRGFHVGRRWQPFGQGLLGGSRSTSTFDSVDGSLSASQTSWGGLLGAGLDYRLTPRWAARGQVDYLLLHSSAGWDADPRLSVGVAYRFAP